LRAEVEASRAEAAALSKQNDRLVKDVCDLQGRLSQVLDDTPRDLATSSGIPWRRSVNTPPLDIEPRGLGFHSLAEELLVLVLEHSCGEDVSYWYGARCYAEDFPDLKNLRLACREYAYLPRLMTALFERVCLVRPLEYLELLRSTGLSWQKQYVRRVVFALDKDHVPSVLNVDAGIYAKASREIATRLPRVQALWVDILRQLPKIGSVYIGYMQPQLFEPVLASLGAAGTEIRLLHVDNLRQNRRTEHDFAWTTNGRLDELNLSKLHTLTWTPTAGDSSNESFNVPDPSGKAVIELVKRCSNTIQRLSVGDEFIWVPFEPCLSLPKLNHLYIGNLCGLTIASFTGFLRKSCPSLKRLTMNGPRTAYDKDIGVQEVLDVIRDHPGRLHVEFDRFPSTDIELVDFSHVVGGGTQYASCKEDKEKHIYYSLAMYLSGTGRWNKSMRYCLDYAGEDVEEYDSGVESE